MKAIIDYINDDQKIYSLAIIMAMLLMIATRSPLAMLGLVALIIIRLGVRDAIGYVEASKKLSEMDRVTALEREVKAINNANAMRR